MKTLYLTLLLLSVSIPLIYTVFFKDVIRYWKMFLISTTLVATFFIIWDFFFTKSSIWGFNNKYTLGIDLLGMPIEEWLFFFIIPFCSLFIHYALNYLKPNFYLKKKATYYLTLNLIMLLAIIVFSNMNKAYTVLNFCILIIVLFIGIKYQLHFLQRFYVSFVLILIPFLIINGILTGLFLEEPIVSYNANEILGVRIFTIPIEDVGYAFSMLFSNLIIFEYFKAKKITFKNVSLS